MALKDLFKPKWQSENINKAIEALEKIKKQEDICDAAVRFYYLNREFIKLFDKLNETELIEKSGTEFLLGKFKNDALSDSEFKYCTPVMSKLEDNNLLENVLLNLEIYQKNSRYLFFINFKKFYLENNLISFVKC